MATFDKAAGTITIPSDEVAVFMGIMGFTKGAIDDEYLAKIPGSLRDFFESIRDSAVEFASVVKDSV